MSESKQGDLDGVGLRQVRDPSVERDQGPAVARGKGEQQRICHLAVALEVFEGHLRTRGYRYVVRPESMPLNASQCPEDAEGLADAAGVGDDPPVARDPDEPSLGERAGRPTGAVPVGEPGAGAGRWSPSLVRVAHHLGRDGHSVRGD